MADTGLSCLRNCGMVNKSGVREYIRISYDDDYMDGNSVSARSKVFINSFFEKMVCLGLSMDINNVFVFMCWAYDIFTFLCDVFILFWCRSVLYSKQ